MKGKKNRREITELTKVDLEYATKLGGTIKLVGVSCLRIA